MIVDLKRFVETERPYWTELERTLERQELNQQRALSIDELRRFHYLYDRTAAGLATVSSLAAEPETRHYLETLVARAYGEVHETRERQHRFSPLLWLFQTLPQASAGTSARSGSRRPSPMAGLWRL